MKKFLTLALLACAFCFAAQSVKAEEPFGYALFGEYTAPADFTIPGAKKSSKVGEATCKSVFFVKIGDCSITQAMANGKMTAVNYADWDKFSVLGIYNTKTLKVYGY